MPASVKVGCLPRVPCTTNAPKTEAIKTLPSNRLFKSPMISSSTNVVAANGVLNAAAKPAAAPTAEAARQFCLTSPSSRRGWSREFRPVARWDLRGPDWPRRRC